MKMTKIDSARIIAQSTDNPVCRSILCSSCFNSRKGKTCKDGNLMAIEKAKSYIKRHEGKSKKKPKPVEEPKSTAVNYEPCVSCRNNHGLCSTKERTENVKNCVSYDPIIKKKVESKPVVKVGIDNSDITLAKPTVKENLSVPCEEECPANSEYPDPIRVDIPDIFYCPTPQGILRFKRSQIILKDTNNDDCLLKYHEEYPCYRTIEEALIIAKKLWHGEGK